jgi:hypothetical protein
LLANAVDEAEANLDVVQMRQRQMLRRRAGGCAVVPVDAKQCDTCDALRERRKRSDRARVVERGLAAR